jgi:hypothetical protein
MIFEQARLEYYAACFLNVRISGRLRRAWFNCSGGATGYLKIPFGPCHEKWVNKFLKIRFVSVLIRAEGNAPGDEGPGWSGP